MSLTFFPIYRKSYWSSIFHTFFVFDYLRVNINCVYLQLSYKSKLTVKMDRQQSGNEDSIQVLVRIKPGCDDQAVIYTSNEIKLDRHSFAFDRIFPPDAHQEDLFNAVGKKVIAHTLEGYNGCIFVYGQTGSGKTYTMMGNNNGLMQRSFCQFFSKLDRLASTQCIVTCSYYQLYNEQIIDLLDTRKEKKSLNLRQDVKRGVFVQNLTEESALNADKLLECLNLGMKNRHIGQTMMNRQSSRSHSIFTVSLAMKSEIDGKKVLKTPKLHFVDLAGSQRQKMTNATGQRLKQAGNINKSLTTLGMVINALASDKSRTHIPYRDSKLTCLLKDSLGGNSKTFIVATVSTSILCFQETLSTLNFANRAKMVKVKALINEESLSTNIQHYKEEIRKLRQEIAKLKSQKRVGPAQFNNNPNDTVISKNSADLQHKFEALSNKIEDLKCSVGNSSLENVIQFFNKTKNDRMLEETERPETTTDMQEEGNELIEYMMSNHNLLKKIHSTINDYTQLREEIKNVEFSRRMPLQDIKTPSKFQRDQYEVLLQRRQTEIKALQQKIVALKESIMKKDVEYRELKKRLTSIQCHNQSKEESMIRLRTQQQDLEKRCIETQMKYQLLQEQKMKIERVRAELELRLKEEKQLYHYAQEKYQNQRFIKNKLEGTIKQLNKKMNALEQDKKEEEQHYREKIEVFQDQLLEKERKEEELKMEIDILNQTLEFDKKKIKQYSDKISDNYRLIQELTHDKFKLTQELTQLIHQKQSLNIEHQRTVNALTLKNKELSNTLTLLQQQLSQTRNQHSSLKVQHSRLLQESKKKINSLEQQLAKNQELQSQINNLLNTMRIDHQKLTYEAQRKTFELQRSLECLRSQLTVQTSLHSLLQQKYTAQKQTWMIQSTRLSNENTQLAQDIAEQRQKLSLREARISELQTQVLSTKNIVQEHQQLKKTYKEVIKQNYKLKGQYISTSTSSLNQTAKNQELISKVAYYQEKFRLMSLQYNKVQEVSKKLKQKELSLIKKLEYYEESQKLKKMHSSHDEEEIKGENLRSLQLENAELKEALEKMTKLYETKVNAEKKEDYSKRLSLQHEKFELQQREEKIRRKLQSAIKNWDHAKENNCSGMQIDELFNCWEKIEHQSRKKIEGINRSIKRQQKLKIQNGFIIKENAYLKERVETLQREINLAAFGEPRKMIKPNEELA